MSSHETGPVTPQLSEDADQERPDLSTIPPLRSVEEVEQAARPGLTDHERRAEDRYAERGTRDAIEQLPIPAPGGSRISGGPSVGGTPSAFGGFSVEAGPLQVNRDDKDDADDEDQGGHAHR